MRLVCFPKLTAALILVWLPFFTLAHAQDAYNTKQAFEDFRQQNYIHIDSECAAILALKDPNPKLMLYLIYQALGNYQNISHLDEWIAADPQSPAAWACLGRACVYAVAADPRSEFAGNLKEKGQKALDKACALSPGNGYLWTLQMEGQIVFHRDNEVERSFQNAVRADPDCYSAYCAKMNFMFFHAHSDVAAVKTFIDASVAAASPGSRVRLLTVVFQEALWDLSPDRKEYFKDPSVWTPVQKAFEDYLKINPTDIPARSWYARISMIAGQYETALRQFNLLKDDDWMYGGWGSQENFEGAKKFLTKSITET